MIFKRSVTAVGDKRQVIEIWNQKGMVATLYPTDHGVRIISKHPLLGMLDERKPNALNVTIGVVQ